MSSNVLDSEFFSAVLSDRGSVQLQRSQMSPLSSLVHVLLIMVESEIGSLQATACGVIANFLCWELCNAIDQTSLNDANDEVVDTRTLPIASALESFNGKKKLFDLLTSPAACVHVLHNTEAIQPIVNGKRQPLPVTARTSSSGTSNVQGVAAKESSRALCLLFSPHHMIPYTDASRRDDKMPMLVDVIHSERFPRPWIFHYYHKSGALKDRYIAYVLLLRMSNGVSLMRGRGEDSIGRHVLRGEGNLDVTGEMVWLFTKTYIRAGDAQDHSHSLQEWMEATGMDDEDGEIYRLAAGGGRSHVSHTGYWSTEFTHDVLSKLTAADRRLSDYECTPLDSVSGGESAIVGSPLGLLRRRQRQHQRRAGDDVAVDLNPIAEAARLRSSGLWGVWETSGADEMHFELRKGGVYRAVPFM